MKSVIVLLLNCILYFAPTSIWAQPARVILIRHGEKPAVGAELSPQGCERANLLPAFFEQWPDIASIYAQQPPDANSSLRPLQTVVPTAQNRNLKINNSYVRDDYMSLVADILKNPELDGKTVVISWEHSVIPKIAAALGVQISSQLSIWPSSTFDQAWIVHFNSAEKTVQLQIVAEHVLPTDIDNTASGVENWGVETPPVDNGIRVPQEITDQCQTGNSVLNKALAQLVVKPLPQFVEPIPQ